MDLHQPGKMQVTAGPLLLFTFPDGEAAEERGWPNCRQKPQDAVVNFMASVWESSVIRKGVTASKKRICVK